MAVLLALNVYETVRVNVAGSLPGVQNLSLMSPVQTKSVEIHVNCVIQLIQIASRLERLKCATKLGNVSPMRVICVPVHYPLFHLGLSVQ